MEGFEKGGFVTFGLAEGGFAGLMPNDPIRTTEGLRTHKIWIPENDLISAEVLKRVGINPIPLPVFLVALLVITYVPGLTLQFRS